MKQREYGMAESSKQPMHYTEAMRVIGYFIAQEHLSEVSILEYSEGWIIHGLTFKSTPQGFTRVMNDYLLSHEDLHRLKAQMEGMRRDKGRRWI